jgi:hypothetical protein
LKIPVISGFLADYYTLLEHLRATLGGKLANSPMVFPAGLRPSKRQAVFAATNAADNKQQR